MKRKDAGFSLIEVMMVLAILAIALALALPSFREALRRNRTTSVMHLVSASMAMARSTAVMRRTAVVVCPRDAAGNCRADSDWSLGWTVFVDANGNRRVDQTGDVLRIEDSPAAGDGGFRLVSNRPLLRYQADGRSANTNLTLSVCAGNLIAGEIKVNNLGRVRTSRANAGQPCPA